MKLSTSERFIRKTQILSIFFRIIPFVRGIFLNGSVATGEATDMSDIDLLIVAKSGRLYTTRFFVLAFTSFIGQKRDKDENKSHAGKFCINYFTTDDYLKIPTGRGEKIDSYCAKNYSRSVLIRGEEKLFKKFLETNQELFAKYNCNVIARSEIRDKAICDTKRLLRSPGRPRNGNKSIIQILLELILSERIGDLIERKLKAWQIRKIESDERTSQYPDLIVYNDDEARFHPPSRH